MSSRLLKPENRITVCDLHCAPCGNLELPLQVQVYSDFSNLPEFFQLLFEEVGSKSVYLTLPWFKNFAKSALNSSDQIRIYGVTGSHQDRRPKGLFAGKITVKGTGFFSLRKLSSLSNYYSPLFAPHLVGSENEKRETVRALTRAIGAEKPRWDAVELKPLDVDSQAFALLVQELSAAGFVVQTYLSAGNWYEPVNGRSYSGYFQSLRSSVRNIAKSKNKKIDRSGRVRYEIITGENGLEAAIAAYNQVYSASWKVPEPYPEFIPSMIRMCGEQRTLRLGLAYVDGQPAASQVWIVHSGIASIYKIAYDQKFRDLSIGTYLTTKLMEYVMDVDRVNEVDYLTGDDNYKKDWMSKRRERWGILALNPRTPRGAIAIARHVGGRSAKRAALSLMDRFRTSAKKPVDSQAGV